LKPEDQAIRSPRHSPDGYSGPLHRRDHPAASRGRLRRQLCAKDTRQEDSARFWATGHQSAFDDQESYELTQLGAQFVHYAMTDLPIKIAYSAKPDAAGQE
jgi:hypothetical protein